MKRQVTLPDDEQQKTFTLPPEGEKKFQITDIHEETDTYVTAICEIVEGEGEGKNIFYRVALSGDFLWLTKLFLKCIGEPHTGDVAIDTEAWIGRRFKGEVKYTVSKDGKTYANIKKLIPSEEPQPVKAVALDADPKSIAWED